MISFRKKILFSDLILFLLFLGLLFPFVGKTVSNILHRSLEERASELIDEIKQAPSEQEMVHLLRERQLFVFFRVSLINNERRLIYESHAPKPLEENYSQDYSKVNPDVEQAFIHGVGYSEGYSQAFSQSFTYLAKAFSFQGRTYVLRTAFPFKEIEELTNYFEIGFLSLGAIILLLYSLMTWAIIHRLSSPIQEIINAIKPYQEGKEEFLPRIECKGSTDPADDFGKLAQTLNSLNEKIQKQIETVTYQRNENESILESLVEGIVAFNSQGIVTYANPKACKMLGVAKGALLGKSLEEVKGKSPFSLLEKCKELVLGSQQKADILYASISVGDMRKVHLDLIAIPKVFKSGAILVLQDKTSDFRVLEMGKDFIANASHELRTPITIIRGFAETLQDLPELSPEMLKEITEKIVRTCDRLNNLVKNILTLADIENIPASRFQECDLGAIVENCQYLLLSVHKDVLISVEEKREGIKVAGDAVLIELAVMNLLENAVKYSSGTPQIHIELDIVGESALITIEDKGIGIPPHDLEHIFERFYTVDKARSRRHGGAGLGLSIVKTIIEKHGGEISVSSTIGVGTRFVVTFPSLGR